MSIHPSSPRCMMETNNKTIRNNENVDGLSVLLLQHYEMVHEVDDSENRLHSFRFVSFVC